MTSAAPGRLGESRAERFRAMMSGFPSGVAVVTTLDAAGAPHGLTCTSVCSVSLVPPTLLVCLDNRSGTLRGLADNGLFTVNLLHTGGRGAAEVFASPEPDRFARIDWESSPLHGLPALTAHAHAVAECRVTQSVPAGDHTIVVGDVEHVLTRDEDDLLLYGRRRYGSWAHAAEVPVR